MLSSRTSLLDKLLKIKALADNGIEGEKEAAKQKLLTLMDQYELTDEDLGIPERYYFNYNKYDKLSRNLLSQVIYSVVGDIDIYRHRGKSDLGCDCSKAEAIEIQAKYDFYYDALKHDMELLLNAFIMKNHIYPPRSKRSEKDIEDGANIEYSEEAERAYLLAKSLKKRDYYQELED